jgi:hypothetical protein
LIAMRALPSTPKLALTLAARRNPSVKQILDKAAKRSGFDKIPYDHPVDDDTLEKLAAHIPRTFSYVRALLLRRATLDQRELKGKEKRYSGKYRNMALEVMRWLGRRAGAVPHGPRGGQWYLHGTRSDAYRKDLAKKPAYQGLLGKHFLDMETGRTNPPRSLMQLGRVVNVELDNGSLVTPSRKLILAWGNRKLHLCIPAKGNPGSLSSNVRDMHRKFHGADPGRAIVADCPTPKGGTKTLGLIKAITYQATGINSPAKKRHNWRHLFGDTGHEGRESHPKSLMPAMVQDAAGNVFIRRRAGNKYTVGVYDDGEAYIIG